MRPSVARRLVPLLSAQHGVVTSAQLRSAKVDLAVPRREGWLKLATGLWVVTQQPEDEQLLMALHLYAPDALASGALACRWHGLQYPPDDPGGRAVAQHGVTPARGLSNRPARGRPRPRAGAPLPVPAWRAPYGQQPHRTRRQGCTPALV